MGVAGRQLSGRHVGGPHPAPQTVRPKALAALFAALESALKVVAIWLALGRSLACSAADSSLRSAMSLSSLA